MENNRKETGDSPKAFTTREKSLSKEEEQMNGKWLICLQTGCGLTKEGKYFLYLSKLLIRWLIIKHVICSGVFMSL